MLQNNIREYATKESQGKKLKKNSKLIFSLNLTGIIQQYTEKLKKKLFDKLLVLLLLFK